jgi:membrane fusion protein (multidrug efflux system)
MNRKPVVGRTRLIRSVALSLGMTAALVLLMLWLVGAFQAKIDSTSAHAASARLVGNRSVRQVEKVSLPVTESAAGTVRPVHEVALASKILAKVAETHVRAGDAVEAGQVVVRLEDADLKARRLQAEAAVAAAQAVRDQAKIETERVERLRQQNAASAIEMDRVNALLLSAEAELMRAQQQLEEAQTVLAYATVTSPISGIVVDKLAEAGDTVTPGAVLVKLYDQKRMQLVASVRESLTHSLEVGKGIAVEIDSLNLHCQGTVSEIVPEAESASRTFTVKVTGPCPKGVYPNMFGRLLVPLGEEEVIVVPVEAVRRIGQLTVVDVVEGEHVRRRSVQLGRLIQGRYEVLSGLREGDKVAVDEPPTSAPGEEV